MTTTATEKFDVLNRFSNAVQFTAEISCAPDATVSVKLGLAVKWAVKTRANLAGANLADAYLADAYLADANLAGAYLADAYLADANLAGANLAGANLAGAYLAGANLAGANLAGANLARANLAGANLAGAYLAGANLAGANLAGAYLTRAEGVTDTMLKPIKADLWMTLAYAPNEVAGLIDALKSGRVDGSQYTGSCACLVGTLANVGGYDYHKLPHDSSAPAERWFASINKGDKPGDDSAGGFAAEKALAWAEEFHALCGPRVIDGLAVRG